MNFFRKKTPENTSNFQSQPFQNRIPKQKSENDCEIKVKRNKEGKIVGLQRKGNCSRADIDAFKSQNGLDLDND